MAITCDPAALASASACYCYDKRTANAVLIYLLAQVAGNTMAPDALARAARCYCIGDAKSRDAVLFYLLCQAANAGGSTTTCTFLEGDGDPTGVTTPTFIGQLYHDTVADTYYRSTGLTVADWVAIGSGGVSLLDDPGPMDLIVIGSTVLTGAISLPNLTADLGAEGIGFTLCNNITSLSFGSLSAISAILFIEANTALLTFSMPVLVNFAGNFAISNNPLLTTVDLPMWVQADGTSVTFIQNALSADSVEKILRRLVLAGVTTCTIDLSGGTNAGVAALNAQGQADVVTLGAQLTINA